MNVKDIEAKVASGELIKHHTAYFRGYVSRVGGDLVHPYDGKFGSGFVVRSPNRKSTRYSYVTYYVER